MTLALVLFFAEVRQGPRKINKLSSILSQAKHRMIVLMPTRAVVENIH